MSGEKGKEKEKEKHSSTGSISSKSSLSSNSTVGSNGPIANNNISSGPFTNSSNHSSTSSDHKFEPTWVHEMFEGTLTNETRCLCCETVSNTLHSDRHFQCLSVWVYWQWNMGLKIAIRFVIAILLSLDNYMY